jgi:hypothetical protein
MLRAVVIRLVGAGIVSAVLLLAACGDDDSSKPSSGSGGVATAPQRAATGPSGRTRSAPARSKRKTPKPTARSLITRGLGPKPGASKLSQSQRVAYLKAQRACAGLGVKATARSYGVDSDNPVEVARAYAIKAFTGAARQAAFKGCLAGFR